MQQEKATKILLAASKIFAKFGVTKTTVDEIARLAKVAKGTVYNYFGSKDGVYLEVLRKEHDDLITKISIAVEAASSPMEKLKTYVDVKFHCLQHAVNMLDLDRNKLVPLLPIAEDIRKQYFEKTSQILCCILKEGVAQGYFFIEDTIFAAKAINYALRGFEITWLMGESEHHDIKYYIEKMIDMICFGIATKRPAI